MKWVNRVLLFAAVVGLLWLEGWLWRHQPALVVPVGVVIVVFAAALLVSWLHRSRQALAEQARQREAAFWRSSMPRAGSSDEAAPRTKE
jgi:NADH:ubiquinone oxidoreductase subunit H